MVAAEDFSVWAPNRGRVAVRVDGVDHPMTCDARGWWRTTVPGAGTGSDYGFLLDDDAEPLPDPRSLWQPAGVHGLSRRYAHDAHTWSDTDWSGRPLAGGVVYELHVGTFTDEGTLSAAIDKLDHLVELGVDFVELMPVNAFDGDVGWGYDGVLWYAVHEPYGGPDALKRFVDACHGKGLAVLLDVVYNHLGPSGAYLDRFGPYFAGHNRWGPALNLDGVNSNEVRRYVIDNALGWLRDFHLDGLRLDAVHALHDSNAVHLLEEMAVEVDALAAHLRRPLSLIAESDLNDASLVNPREAGGYGLTAQWNDDVHHCVHAAITGERQGYYGDFGSLHALAETMRGVFFHAGTWSSFRGRTHGRPVDIHRVSGHRFLVYVQNHDQIGNRAVGDRISASVSPGLLGAAAALVLCSPFTPMIFMGEEWGSCGPWQFFASFPDPELADRVRTGRRAEFADHGWATDDVPDPVDPATAARSRLRWSELDDPVHRRIYDIYRGLIALRRAYPEFTDPRLYQVTVDVDETQRWIVLRRGRFRVICNLSTDARQIPFTPAGTEVLLAGGPVQLCPGGAVVAGETFAVIATGG